MNIPPLYIKLGHHPNASCLRYIKDDNYYIDNGNWHLDYKCKNGKFYSKSEEPLKHLDNIELVPITREEYTEAAGHYLPDEY